MKFTNLSLQIKDSENKTRRYIDMKLENVAYDILGAQKDRFEDHERKIVDHEQRIDTLEMSKA